MNSFRLFWAVCFVFFLSAPLLCFADDAGCDAEFVNPLTDVEWSCLYPIRMAGMTLSPSGPDPETKVSTILCKCRDGAFDRVGIAVGFREPSRLMDVVKPSLCMASLGFSMGDGSLWQGGAGVSMPGAKGGGNHIYAAQTHYYFFNPLSILEIMMDMSCMENFPLDVAAMSELDPLATDEELALLAFPETVLFSNPVTVLACAADAVSATAGSPIDALFWCAGSWGTTYPLVNTTTGYEGNWVTSAAMIAAKQLSRGHRELLNWGTKGDAAMCGPYPQPIWKKSQYKLQMVRPVKMRNCAPIGRSGLLWDYGKNPPTPGREGNFVFLVWRYRDCCVF